LAFAGIAAIDDVSPGAIVDCVDIHIRSVATAPASMVFAIDPAVDGC
jgi:hypothetical protein